MGNDSSYTVKISGSPKEVDAILKYIARKTRRWKKWQDKTEGLDPERRAAEREREMSRHGIARRAGFVTWGFDLEGREDDGETSTATLRGWANENSSNCHISGEEGELADLHAHFPDAEYDVEYTDDYSSGFCLPPHFDKQEREE